MEFSHRQEFEQMAQGQDGIWFTYTYVVERNRLIFVAHFDHAPVGSPTYVTSWESGKRTDIVL